MNLTETKNKVAQDLGYEDWKELVKDQSNFGDAWFDLIVTNVAELHAPEKVKEALKLAAERVNYPYRDEYGCMCNVPAIVMGLETELIENIKNEK